MLAVTEQTVALNEMGFSDKHANIAQRIFGKVDTSASSLAQYTESKPARLPPVEEIRRMKKEKENKKKDPVKAEKEKDKSPKEKKTKIAVAASDDVMVLLSRSCDLVVQMYLTMAEQHSNNNEKEEKENATNSDLTRIHT